jgi:hypothetical protein
LVLREETLMNCPFLHEPVTMLRNQTPWDGAFDQRRGTVFHSAAGCNQSEIPVEVVDNGQVLVEWADALEHRTPAGYRRKRVNGTFREEMN